MKKVKFCGKCGKKHQNEIVDKKEVTGVKLEENSNTAPSNNYDFLYVPISRLIWASILSFGLYTIYWFSSNWRAIQRVSGEKMSTFWRGVFSIFWSNKPFDLALKQAKELGYKYNDDANFLSAFYVIATIVNQVISRSFNNSLEFVFIWLVAGELIVLYPLIKVQNAVNYSNDKKGGEFDKVGRAEFGLIAIAWVIVILVSIASV